MTEQSIRSRTKSLLAALSEGIFERETAIQLAFLTTIAGESIFLLGPPGVGYWRTKVGTMKVICFGIGG